MHLFLGAIPHDDHLVQEVSVFAENDVDDPLSGKGNLLRGHSQIGELQDSRPVGNSQRPCSVRIGRRAGMRPLDDHSGAGERVSVRVGNRPAHHRLGKQACAWEQ